MALYLSIILIIFVTLVVASFYKNRSSVSIRFLFGIFIGWVISIVCLILYLSKHSYYWKEVSNIFYITQELWNILIIKMSISSEVLIRCMNIGVGLLLLCVVCFGIAFTSKENKANNKKYMLLAIPPLLQVIFFDSIIQKNLQFYAQDNLKISFDEYTVWCAYLQQLFKFINLGYCISMIAMLVNYYIVHPKIKFLKMYTLFNIVCICPITIMFYYLFRWYPVVLIKITMKKDYYNYLIPNFQVDILNNKIYYLIFVLAYIALIIYIYKYKTMENYYKADHVKINISMDTASLGINTFTHAIKNHIQGIRTEAEYLNKQYGENEEISISTKLILESCDFSFNSIENANKQLKNIDLNLKLIDTDRPIENALNKFQGLVKAEKLAYKTSGKATRAYIDEESFTEVIVNLISNAIDATIHKEDAYIEVAVKEQGGWGIIEIIDNGQGIEPENLNKIFAPFFSTKSSVNNWGVGLAFCYKIVTAHDGKITVDSEVGKGTTFTIALPIM